MWQSVARASCAENRSTGEPWGCEGVIATTRDLLDRLFILGRSTDESRLCQRRVPRIQNLNLNVETVATFTRQTVTTIETGRTQMFEMADCNLKLKPWLGTAMR